MESLQSAQILRREGRFFEALRVIGSAATSAVNRNAVDVLRADLLEHVGQHSDATSLVSKLLRTNRLTDSERSASERVFGYVLLESGDIDGALAHLQSSAALAVQAGDLESLFLAQARIMLVVSERSGPGAATPMLADVRQLATKLGDPHISAALHLYVAEMEARRGLLRNAAKHAGIARNILSTVPNLYLEAFAENLALALAVLRSQFAVGRSHGLRAVELAESSGVKAIYRASVANLGNLFYATGDFDRAVEFFERALAALPSTGEKTNASLDTLARVRLSQGQFDDCAALLDQIEASVRTEQDRSLYAHRHAELTRAQLLADRGELEAAMAKAESALALATLAGDTLLTQRIHLVRASILCGLDRIPAAMTILRSMSRSLIGQPPELYAQYEQIFACAEMMNGSPSTGEAHYKRALRIHEGLGTVPGRMDLQRAWNQAVAVGGRLPTTSPVATRGTPPNQMMHGLASLLAHSDRPGLVAREIIDVLAATDSVHSARAVATRTEEPDETLSLRGSPSIAPVRQFSLGVENDREIRLLIQPKEDVESTATMNALTVILNAMQELERARIEREERATLWPSDDTPSIGGHSVIAGHMRDRLNYARKVATTNVNVLITGESGTGKEILARAIHDFSDRAQKPFVPFNCAAIPRDLLESQLFGHRRGAFTGADRDQLGIIRTARDGTLFLDEIGELGLDLQPKILRFLESGEIAPLGEPSSMTVNVRIVAATNTNLEDAVRAGRFREDLFYRLNVVHLTILPLRERRDEIPGLVNHFVARAAKEFKKGRLGVAEETMERLILYRWPGNVRQLQNELRRMVALAEPDSILTADMIAASILDALPFARPARGSSHEIAVPLHSKLMPTLARVEGEMIRAAWAQHQGKVEAVAKALGISRKGLYLKRQRLGL
jgi:DNA-binding NtrC family response regulator/tetratricopeptide (TPR) repeat protein